MFSAVQNGQAGKHKGEVKHALCLLAFIASVQRGIQWLLSECWDFVLFSEFFLFCVVFCFLIETEETIPKTPGRVFHFLQTTPLGGMTREKQTAFRPPPQEQAQPSLCLQLGAPGKRSGSSGAPLLTAHLGTLDPGTILHSISGTQAQAKKKIISQQKGFAYQFTALNFPKEISHGYLHFSLACSADCRPSPAPPGQKAGPLRGRFALLGISIQPREPTGQPMDQSLGSELVA